MPAVLCKSGSACFFFHPRVGVLAKHAQTRQVSDMGCPSEYKSVSTKEGKILRIVVSIAAVIVFLNFHTHFSGFLLFQPRLDCSPLRYTFL